MTRALLLQSLLMISYILNSFVSLRQSRKFVHSTGIFESRSKLSNVNSEYGTEKQYQKDSFGRNGPPKGPYSSNNRFDQTRRESFVEQRRGVYVDPTVVRSYPSGSSRSEDGFKRSYPPSQMYRSGPDRTDSNRRRYEYDYTREEKTEPVYGYYDGDHLYGIAPVRMALHGARRNISELLVQTITDLSNKKDETSAKEIISLAQKLSIPIREFSKHDLNMLSDNRPHQGFILRAKPLQFERILQLEPSDKYRVVLALDEVWDPQNFGALLRTSYFLGCHKVVVCAKNSAPLSPVVSKASSGAMEVMTVFSTDNMMRFLDRSTESGWQVVGTDLGEKSIELKECPMDRPTVVVLGNEGHGVRTNVLRRCSHLVKIAGGKAISGATDSSEAMVDSLNVSVTGGIVLHHFLSDSSPSSTPAPNKESNSAIDTNGKATPIKNRTSRPIL
mmetsp:Transcript_27998/g.39837  ORF Transcript_27998/g.39837 Transcript_27998/m.39837 type:complete len:445 (+) Transcript_27998:10-1344(+)